MQPSPPESRAAQHTCNRLIGSGVIAFAILFNVPFSILGAMFDYPDILRQPAGEVLDRFAQGGASLVLTWYSFGLAALALVPVALALSITPSRLARFPALTIGAAIAGALAGVTQAIGLMRWVFAIPAIAAAHADPTATDQQRLIAEAQFSLLNAWGGVAIGEHIGQLLTALFVALLSVVLWREAARSTATLGQATALMIAIGTGEGLALALGCNGEVFSLLTIAGFLGLTAWLILCGIRLIRAPAL